MWFWVEEGEMGSSGVGLAKMGRDGFVFRQMGFLN